MNKDATSERDAAIADWEGRILTSMISAQEWQPANAE